MRPIPFRRHRIAGALYGGLIVAVVMSPLLLAGACVATSELGRRSAHQQLDRFIFADEFVLERGNCGSRFQLFGPCARLYQSPAFGEPEERFEFYLSRAHDIGWRCGEQARGSVECTKGDWLLTVYLASGAGSPGDPCAVGRLPNPCMDYLHVDQP